MSKIINGKEIAANLRNQLKEEIIQLKKKHGSVPGLAVVQVGNNAASSVYVKSKTKHAMEVGIEIIDHHLEESTTQEQLLTLNHNDILLIKGSNSSLTNTLSRVLLKKRRELIV